MLCGAQVLGSEHPPGSRGAEPSRSTGLDGVTFDYAPNPPQGMVPRELVGGYLNRNQQKGNSPKSKLTDVSQAGVNLTRFVGEMDRGITRTDRPTAFACLPAAW